MSRLNFSFHPRVRAVWAVFARRFGRRQRRCAERRACEPRVDDGGPYVGWFDSSHDLLNGLAVTEHGDLDDLVLPGFALAPSWRAMPSNCPR